MLFYARGDASGRAARRPVDSDFVWDYRRTPPRRKAPVPEKTTAPEAKRRRSHHRRGKEAGDRPPRSSS
jgi:hypothetical protein